MRNLLFLLLISFSLPTWATTYWVTSSGAGSADGTSLDNACNGTADTDCFGASTQPLATAGDTVCFSGPFTGFLINTTNAGTAGNPVTLNFAGTGVCAGATPATLSRTDGMQLLQVDVDYQKIVGGTWGAIQSGSNAQINILAGADNTVFDGITMVGPTGGSTWWGILGNLNNGATNIDGITIVNSSFSGYTKSGFEPIRLVPRNSSSACTSTGYFANVSITYSSFKNNVVAIRAVPLANGDPNFGTCLPTLTRGFIFSYNTVDRTVAQGINFATTTTAGYPCTIGHNTFTNNGDGTSETYNTIQTTKSDYCVIEYNYIDGAVDAGTNGDGIGIVADMGGASPTYKSQYLTIRGNIVKNVESNGNACGIEVWRADYAKVYGNLVTGSRYGICLANSGVVGAEIFNNTIIGDSDSVAGLRYYISAEASTLYNNITIGGQYSVVVESGSTAPTDGYNDFYGYSTAKVSGTYTPAGTSVEVSPIFIGGNNPLTLEGAGLRSASSLRRGGRIMNIGNYPDCDGKSFLYPPSIGACEEYEVLNRTTRN